MQVINPNDIELGLRLPDKKLKDVHSHRDQEDDDHLMQHFEEQSTIKVDQGHQFLLNNPSATRSILKNKKKNHQILFSRSGTSSFVSFKEERSQIRSKDATPIRLRQGKIAEDTIADKGKNKVDPENIRTSINDF